MIHARALDQVQLVEAYLTIGVFDGVHRGHQALLGRLVAAARAAGVPSVVLTFAPHPAAVLSNQAEFPCLTTPEERADLLAGLGVDVVITQHFDRSLASQSAEAFMERLTQTLGLRRLFIGYDFALGRGREGNAARLRELGHRFGYDVEVIKPLYREGEIISATNIRAHLLAGRVEEAAALLGRPYAIRGIVQRGDGRGRLLDFPTANLTPPAGKLVPANGVYACWTQAQGQRYPSVVNIGVRPTFHASSHTVLLESHLLDFSADLYGQSITVEFIARLRNEVKFPSAEALVEQIRHDVQQARQRLQTE